jgi:hypothetical protein
LKEADNGIRVVTFTTYALGYIDLEQKTLPPIDNPFGTRVLPMSEVRSVTHVSRPDKKFIGAGEGNRTLDTQLGKLMFCH